MIATGGSTMMSVETRAVDVEQPPPPVTETIDSVREVGADTERLVVVVVIPDCWKPSDHVIVNGPVPLSVTGIFTGVFAHA